MNILVINGPNLNLLGVREPDIYGKNTYEELVELIRRHCQARGIGVTFFQSNHEGAIVDEIQSAYGKQDGLVINPAAYTHTSIAIPDAIKAVGLPAVEVHISDIQAREAYRSHSFASEACIATICGRGFQGYLDAVDLLEERLKTQ
ncbi:MAG: type II 3-dehydroquinate dehydratase [Firmicutes bacterium]|nr:type II 3-dehydroquinate dehydratase [Bacillota bacterium]